MVYRSSRIKLSAGQIFWQEAGDSHCPVLIFLHGSWHDRSQWQEIVEPLSKNFHCFALDLLGFGNSTAIETPKSIEIEVDCLHEFLTALKLSSVYLVGHSLGAWIGINYTLKYPDRVRGIVAISPEGFFIPNGQQYGNLTRWLLFHPSLFKFALIGLRGLSSIGDGAILLERKLNYWTFLNQFSTTLSLLFQRNNREITSDLASNKLFQFRKPILILQSDFDDDFSIKQGQAYARSIRNAEYRSLANPSIVSQKLNHQIIEEIEKMVDRIQLKIDREEVELW
jgi:pimeloyl-ACP methyl ester carboxylesterase